MIAKTKTFEFSFQQFKICFREKNLWHLLFLTLKHWEELYSQYARIGKKTEIITGCSVQKARVCSKD